MDKDLLKRKIHTAFENFKTAIRKHADINKKRADGGWAVGEIGNHIIKSTGSDFGRTKKTERPYDQDAAAIRDLFLDFTAKFPQRLFSNLTKRNICSWRSSQLLIKTKRSFSK